MYLNVVLLLDRKIVVIVNFSLPYKTNSIINPGCLELQLIVTYPCGKN